ncbi:MAG: stage III sporulation protein AB [Clostridia bacterium]|nr:stage III sporulation protein AB [Clostridia bacterium]
MQILKWISLGLIFTLSTLIGNIKSKKYIDRVKELKDLKMSFNIIETKIRYTYKPLKDIFEELSKGSEKEKIKELLANLSQSLENLSMQEAWESALNTTKLNLNEEDLGVISPIGKMLGKTDKDGQVSELKVIMTFLDKQIEKAEIEKAKNEKLYKTLGLITGMAIVILLI